MEKEIKKFTIWGEGGKTTDNQTTYRIVKESEHSYHLEMLRMKEVGAFDWEKIGGDDLGWSAVSWLVTSDTFQNLFID